MKMFQCSGILLLTIVALTLTSPGYKMGELRAMASQSLQSPKEAEKKISDFFPDKSLAEAIALNLNGNSNIDVPITTEELRQLVDLTAMNAKISNLKGLEFAVNLKKLNVDNNHIDTDGMMPLTSLRKLEYLDISNNRILNHKPLGDMAGTALSGPGAIKRINAHNQGIGRVLDATKEADRKLIDLSWNFNDHVLTAKNIVRDKNGRLNFLINSHAAPSVLINGAGYTFNWQNSSAGQFRVDNIPENIHTLTMQSASGQTKIATGFSITITNLDKVNMFPYEF
ncbi:leucine-rich repeat domain-containing protein [Paenilisteria rocourtiae]|uniref:Leucine Rich Repeat (LRR) protein n=1 Tax=Listeria rocourtiae TaxID=647910 RepID=A0A4R6ZGY4_9LIST|nr:leucine-rich repeat domain-containing protein [Listeria rocourtiae]EUJ47428.1 internalin F [Listeria rocourtiae FSL F6-920]TDR51537.1 Leucine Rich Repeat (LRR) protein [Listeria rocourtiae]